MRKLLSRIKIEADDFIFVFSTSKLSSSFIVDRIKSSLAIESYSGKFSDFPSQNPPRLIISENPNIFAKIIRPRFDQNPIYALLMQDPIDNVIERYLISAGGHYTNQQNLPADFHQKFTFSDFLENPKFSKFVDNPQWNSLRSMFAEKNVRLLKGMSVEGQKYLLFEKIEQAAFVGLLDLPELSIDLFDFIFTDKEFSWGEKDFGAIKPLVDRQTRIRFLTDSSSELYDRLSLDFSLYDFAKRRLLLHYRQMVSRLVSEAKFLKRVNNQLHGVIRGIKVRFP